MNLKKLFNIADAETPTWRGVDGSIYRWHGEWADPEVEYRGKLFNGTELEDALWHLYEDECKSEGIEPTEEGFDDFATAEEAEYVLEDYYYSEGWVEDLEEDEISDSIDDEVDIDDERTSLWSRTYNKIVNFAINNDMINVPIEVDTEDIKSIKVDDEGYITVITQYGDEDFIENYDDDVMFDIYNKVTNA